MNSNGNSSDIPRRGFLAQLSAGAGLMIALPALAADSARRKPIEFAVVSDTHLGKGDSLSPERLWKKTAAEVAATKCRFVLHLGDVVDGGREAQYPKYLEARGQIKVSVHEVPGNHDPAELFEKHIRKPVDTAVDYDWLRLILINNSRTDSHLGFLTEQQLDWIDEQLAAAAGRDLLSILCMHVPAHTNQHPDRGWHIKPADGQTRLYEIVRKHGPRVLALFHGHFHNGLRGWNDAAPVHEICFPSALYNQNRGLEEAKAPGYNPDEFRPAYSQVKLGEGKLHIQLRVADAGDALAKELPQPQTELK
jgi:3',5'-cyclic AMP phosphodiesterase CpdA